MPVQMGMGKPSLDVMICAGGWFVMIEAKVKGKKMTPRQTLTAEEVCAAGGLVFLVDDDASLDKAMEVITPLCR